MSFINTLTRYMRRNFTISLLALLIFCTLVLSAFLYGLIAIDHEKIGKSSRLSLIDDDDTTNPIDAVLDDTYFEKLSHLIKRNRPSILKELNLNDVNKYIQYHNEQIALYIKKIEIENEKLQNGEDQGNNENNEAGADDEYNLDSGKKQKDNDDAENENNQIHIDNVDRNLLIKYLKIEKYRLSKKKINTVKDAMTNGNYDLKEFPSVWHYYHFFISELQLYNDTDSLKKVMSSLTTNEIDYCSEKHKGTQIKLSITFKDGTLAMLKPMKVPRDYETPPDHFYFVDFERHHAEIAAYHVDKILGFNRVPPTFGRLLNVTKDLWEKADSNLGKTFFISPAGNTCFTGHCSYYCDTTHAICGKQHDKLEVSLQLMLPRKPYIKWSVTTNPFRRSYNKKHKADWETNENYCEEKVFQDTYFQSKNMLDLIDTTIFDFLIGNMDRHHYEKLVSLSNDSFIIHLDNGRAFGRAFQDEISILAPLTQCCLVRYSTYLRLYQLHKRKFSKLLDESLKIDPLYPILTDAHLKAIDRRMNIIFNEIYKCTQKHSTPQVIIDDGY